VTRRDYQSSVRALFHFLESIYELLQSIMPETKKTQHQGVYLSSDVDVTEMSGGQLNEIEE